MTGTVVSVANVKGGVGKTTVSFMLADALSTMANAKGRMNKVLVVDTDPQANLSYSFIGLHRLMKARDDGRDLKALLHQKLTYKIPPNIENATIRKVSTVLGGTAKSQYKTDISLICCNPDMIAAEREIYSGLGKDGAPYDTIDLMIKSFADEVLTHCRATYDWIIVDCAPGINVISRAFICSSDVPLIVSVPDHLSALGVGTYLSHLGDRGGPIVLTRKPLLLASRLNSQKVVHTRQLQQYEIDAKKNGRFVMLDTRIPEMADLNREHLFDQATLSLTAKYSTRGATLAVNLAKEVMKHA